MMYNNYLIHYGVKGMRWGVRHDPEPIGRGFRSRMNERKLRRREKYRQKLMSKSMAKANRYSNKASVYRSQLSDMRKNGIDSESWQKEVDKRVRKGVADEENGGIKGALSAEIQRYNKKQFEYHKVDIKLKAEHNEKVAKDWLKNNSSLMKMKVDSTTSKRDIRKAFTGNRLNRIEKLNEYAIPKDSKIRKQRIATTVGSAVGITAGLIGSKYVAEALGSKIPLDSIPGGDAIIKVGTVTVGQQLGRYGGTAIGRFIR